MFKRIAMMCFIALCAPTLYAFPCYLTLVKDNCWGNYDVSVAVVDASNNATVTTVVVPKGKTWVRQPFECQPAQQFMYYASFTPMIWESEKGKKYRALRYWSLPDKIEAKATAWNVTVCYASDFAEVPDTPQSTGKCACDFKDIPAVEPK